MNMASAFWDPAREGFALAEIDWDGAVIKANLIRGYNFNAAHKFVSDLTGAGGTLWTTPVTLASKTAPAGVLDAADISFAAVTAGAAYSAIVIYQSSAVTGGADVATSAQRLIAFIDTATGLPVTPNGQAINITWDNGVNRIGKL
jgi:hypothetical protein